MRTREAPSLGEITLSIKGVPLVFGMGENSALSCDGVAKAAAEEEDEATIIELEELARRSGVSIACALPGTELTEPLRRFGAGVPAQLCALGPFAVSGVPWTWTPLLCNSAVSSGNLSAWTVSLLTCMRLRASSLSLRFLILKSRTRMFVSSFRTLLHCFSDLYVGI